MGRVRRRIASSKYKVEENDIVHVPGATAWRDTGSGGVQTFDEYRLETLRRMEEEQQEFAAFVERLRFARDKAEFDQFMAERHMRPGGFDTRLIA